ncbi:protein kinase domain-containing protein [Streptomyces hydrogenans]|uniref:protein kinase domain-containing protein n=1 Tax=Streptomyces hydrogenans TaxID=1873719 RepID=UPI0033BFD77F
MELIDGRSLGERIEENGPLSVDRTASLVAALLTTIGAAHDEGVAHRDIKPGNVMLARDGKTLLTDFGIAVHHTDTALTATGLVVGWAELTAPERLRGVDGSPARFCPSDHVIASRGPLCWSWGGVILRMTSECNLPHIYRGPGAGVDVGLITGR